MVQRGNTKDFEIEDIRIKFIVYGGAGTGKTFLLCSMPKPFLIFHSTLEDGLLFFKMRKIDIPYASFDDMADLNQILAEIETGKLASGCESIAVDGFDRIGDTLIEQVKAENNVKQVTQPQWGTIRDRYKGTTVRLLNIAKSFHLGISAGDMLEKNDLNGNVYGYPDIVGRYRGEIGGLFDVFLYSTANTRWENGKRVIDYRVQTKPYLDFNAKDRTGVLDMDEPNDFNVIYEKFVLKIKEVQAAIESGKADSIQGIPPAFRKMVNLPQALPKEVATDATIPEGTVINVGPKKRR